MAKIPEVDCSETTQLEEDPTLRRLHALICWYEDEAKRNNRLHKGLKIVSIGAAAAIPLSVAAATSPVVGAGLGSVVVALEGIQELFQFQRNWATFGQTKEALKRERSLFDARTGGYEKDNRIQVLAQRMESLVAVETASWASINVQGGGLPDQQPGHPPPGPQPDERP